MEPGPLPPSVPGTSQAPGPPPPLVSKRITELEEEAKKAVQKFPGGEQALLLAKKDLETKNAEGLTDQLSKGEHDLLDKRKDTEGVTARNQLTELQDDTASYGKAKREAKGKPSAEPFKPSPKKKGGK